MPETLQEENTDEESQQKSEGNQDLPQYASPVCPVVLPQAPPSASETQESVNLTQMLNALDYALEADQTP